jgi:hypothetical protein
MAAINAPTNKASDRQSAISPATNIGGWFKNSANIVFAANPVVDYVENAAADAFVSELGR